MMLPAFPTPSVAASINERPVNGEDPLIATVEPITLMSPEFALPEVFEFNTLATKLTGPVAIMDTAG
jgi:hypothetical protein